jgi:tRNA A-37 threonylcarbamoyl transferase component Bud32/tetratricopeptide (TPR) repeat protein
MDENRWQRVKELFCAALESDADSRVAFLNEACAGDAGLRAEVDSLLRAHDTTGDFIETPAAHAALGIAADAEPPTWIGRRVGDYRLVEEVGRGGMSEVYKAVRDDDEYRKDVAVKVLRKGYDTRSFLRRFKVEIQILATLDHPNIARLLDAGSTEEGLPYLVMDYIKGRPIDDYCSFQRLGIAQRLELFRALCGAVQYVHQHLMVHGDLKCSNVLVSDNGTVKLLDFGIARLLNPSPAINMPDPKLTMLLALTPEYASPEQVRGGPITTASDVYSLGVVLYRLLAGVLPYRLKGEFSYELATQILEREAILPSVAAKAHENGETAGFSRQLRGDLDNIVLMALEKDPAKRYPFVDRFDDDIRRHVEGFPVTARSAGYFYQLGKFAGRHKAGIAAVALLLVTLIAGIAATGWQAHIAGLERERAERHFNEVRKLANVFMFDIHGAIADLPGSTPARQMLVENSLKYLAALSAESGNEPSLQRELAAAYEKVADVQGGFRAANLGDTAGAIASYRKALAIRIALSQANPMDRELRRELLRNYGKLSETLVGDGDSKGALEVTRRLVKLAQELAAAPNSAPADRRNMATALATLGFQLTRADQVGDGLLFMRQAVALYESLLEANPEDPEIRRLLAVLYGRMGDALFENTQNNAEALQMNTKSYEIVQKLAAADPHNTRFRKMVGYSLLGMGGALLRLKQPRAALEKQLQAITVLRSTLDADEKNEIARYDAAFALSEASASDIALGDLRSAELRLTDALTILSHAGGITSPVMNNTKVLLGVDYFQLGRTNALRARDPATTTRQRLRYCQEARRWFDLSQPILSEAERDRQWLSLTEGKVAQIATDLAACPSVVTAAK